MIGLIALRDERWQTRARLLDERALAAHIERCDAARLQAAFHDRQLPHLRIDEALGKRDLLLQ